MNGLMDVSMRVNGKTTRWKVTDYSHGLMVGDMKENILTIRRKEKGHFSGPMAGSTKGTGRTGNSTESEFTHQPLGRQREENG